MMRALTYAQAAYMLDHHQMQYRPSDRPGCIDCRAEYCRDGVVSFEWEPVPLNRRALRDWLGY